MIGKPQIGKTQGNSDIQKSQNIGAAYSPQELQDIQGLSQSTSAPALPSGSGTVLNQTEQRALVDRQEAYDWTYQKFKFGDYHPSNSSIPDKNFIGCKKNPLPTGNMGYQGACRSRPETVINMFTNGYGNENVA